MDVPVLRGAVRHLRYVCFGFDNYYDARDFADAHCGLLVEDRDNHGLYWFLRNRYGDLASFRFLVVVDEEVA